MEVGLRRRDPGCEALREEMVRGQLEWRDIHDPLVLEAMRSVPRHLFVPGRPAERAYEDRPLGIGYGQTISQPYIVALMTQLGRPGRARRALDVGTGSGYQAAVLARIVPEVISLEIIPELAGQAATRLRDLGYSNVRVHLADGYRGWPEAAPFDLILVACAPPSLPRRLVEQLGSGGRLIVPVGRLPGQELVCVERVADGRTRSWQAGGVAFVPMVQGDKCPPDADV